MNISNNSRFQSTEDKIEKALFALLHIRKYNDIYVKEICYEAGINRSSFYSHYSDINDLMIKIEEKLSKQIHLIFKEQRVYLKEDFIKLFTFLKEKREFYKAYFESNEANFIAEKDFTLLSKQKADYLAMNNPYSKTEALYHLAFFGGGLNAIAKMWITTNCKETPEEMANIIYNEYTLNSKLMKNKQLF